MKKGVLSFVITVAACAVIAGPVTVTFQTTGPVPALYLEAGFENPVPTGYYAELILLQTDTYVHSQYSSYEVLPTIGYGTGPYNQNYALVGMAADGSSAGAGYIGLKWLNTSYNTSYYIALRFYNSETKSAATWYGVTTPYKLTKTGSTSGSPDWEIKTFVTNTNNNDNQFYTMYPIPEPTTLLLVGMGGLALGLRRKMSRLI